MKKTVIKRKGTKASDGKAEPVSLGFEKLVADAAYGLLIHHNFKPLYVNKAFANLLGYKSPKEVLELPILRSLFSADFWDKVEHDYSDLIKKRKVSQTLRMPLVRKNGKEVWVAGMQSLVEWGGGKAVQFSVFDVSQQVAVEQSLLRAEQHFSSVLEILPYPVYIARKSDGRILFVNRKTCLLFQRSTNAMLRGTSVDFFVDPDEREDLRKLLDSLDDIRDVEVKMKTSSGLEFMVELSAIRMEYNGVPANLIAMNDISDRKALEIELTRQASTDSLTGLANRRSFMALAEQEIRRAQRFERPFSVMMLDVDHFKAINDRYGHAVGDAVLQGIAKRSPESLRQSDQIARLGGEEFAVAMPETNLEAAVRAAERLREHLAERPVIASGKAVPCTISIGVAEMQPGDVSIDDLLRRADEALYCAKKNGRNRVEQSA
jgi:diguanylate cyclase (GGDEF)-like protein/PAS domain S-box-containing protein